MSTPGSLPEDDGHDRELRSLVRPSDHVNPEPAGRYNLVVIGAGSAGLVAAAGAAGLGAKVALVERSLLGGDCLNTGCVPSKALLAAAHRAAAARRGADYGIGPPSPEVPVDFPVVMERMRRLRSGIGLHDSVARFRGLGVDVFLGQAAFRDGRTVEVDGRRLSFSAAVLCTGARPAIPSLPGLDSVPYRTSDTLFSLVRLPPRLGVLGAGAIGCEMAQAFARFGSRVTLLSSGRGLLPGEDREAADLLRRALERDGIRIRPCARRLRLRPGAPEGIDLIDSGDGRVLDTVDELLVAVGRTPDTGGMGLDRAGVEHTGEGIVVDDFLRTTNPRIYAAGDCCSRLRYTHAADFMARAVLRNALFLGRTRLSRSLIPRCTYTEPEVAHAGLPPGECRQRGLVPLTQPLAEVDRAVLEGETEGFVRVHHQPGRGRIRAATVVASHAGELIAPLVAAMRSGTGLGALADIVLPYPTRAEAIRKLGDRYNRSRLTPGVRSLLSRWLAWRR